MQLDYNQASTFLLFEILKATASNGSQPSIPSSPTAFFSPSRSDEWLNSLWFVSLTFSLITALVAVLVKQWLHQYVAIVSDSSARDRARIRHMRYAGLQAWRVPMIIGMLPVLLHVSLALFFAGLAVFLFSLGMKVAWLVSIIGAATYTAYIIALILPLIYPYCPFKVPLTLYVHSLYQFVNDFLLLRIALIRHYPYTRVFRRDNHRWSMYRRRRKSIFQHRSRSLKEIEHDHVQKCAAKVDAQSLRWLHSSTSNVSVHQSVLQAISGMSSTTLKCLPDEYISAFVISLHQQIEHMKALGSSPEVDELFLYYRALTLLHGHPMDKSSIEPLKGILSGTMMPSAVLPGILQGPQRSSLALHSAVWKALINAAWARPATFPLERGHRSVWDLVELELMRILVNSLTTRASRDVTTIDKPTDEMKECMVRKIIGQSEFDYPSFRLPAPLFLFDDLDQHIILALITRTQERLCVPTHASDRKQLIEIAVTMIEHAVAILSYNREAKRAMRPILDLLHSWLTSEALVVVSPDLGTLARHIIMILYSTSYWSMYSLPTSMRFYSVAYQCYLHSLPGGGEIWENDKIGREVAILISTGLDIRPERMFTRYYPHFWSDGLFQVMLFLIEEHNESVLYEWARHPAMQNAWPRCLPQLVQWASGEEFRRWDFLKRVLAIVVIRELQNMLGHSGRGNKSLPKYYSDAYTGVNQPRWLQEVCSSRRAHFSSLIHVTALTVLQ